MELLQLPHFVSAPDAFPGLGHLHDVVLVTQVVLVFGAEVGVELGEESVHLPLVHLLQVGYPPCVSLADKLSTSVV